MAGYIVIVKSPIFRSPQICLFSWNILPPPPMLQSATIEFSIDGLVLEEWFSIQNSTFPVVTLMPVFPYSFNFSQGPPYAFEAFVSLETLLHRFKFAEAYTISQQQTAQI